MCLLLEQPWILGYIPSMSQVHAELPETLSNQADTISMCFGVPATWCHIWKHCTKDFADCCHGNTLHYKVGERVQLVTQDLQKNEGSHKLNPRYIALYQIRYQINKVTYQLALLFPPLVCDQMLCLTMAVDSKGSKSVTVAHGQILACSLLHLLPALICDRYAHSQQ